MCNRKLFYLASICWLCNLFNSAVVAQTHSGENRETLRGIQSFRVIVEELRPEIEEAGLTRSRLQTDVELKLRKIGIQVLTEDEWLELPLSSGRPYLYINANIIKSNTGYYIYNTSVQWLEDVSLVRTPSIVIINAITWNNSFAGGTFDLGVIRQGISDQVDVFVNDYLTVNPK